MTIDSGQPPTDGDRPPQLRTILSGTVAVVALAAVIVWASGRPAGDEESVPSSSLPRVAVPSTTTASTATTHPPSSTSNVVARSPLTDFVPGLVGQLVTLQGQVPMLLITREADSPGALIAVMPGGWVSNVAFDASGDLIGLTVSISESDHLYLGDETELTDPRFLVTSYVWHQTRPAEVAAVIVDTTNESWHLNIFRFDEAPRQINDQKGIATFDTARTVRAWTDSGFVLRGLNDEGPTPFVEVFDPTGEIVWHQPGELLDVSSTGDILIGDYVDETWEVRIVNSDDPNGRLGAALGWAPQGFSAVRWSTSGLMIAFIGYAGPGKEDWGLHVYTPDGAILHSEVIPWRVWDIQWSPDDRYILMPGSDNQGTHAVVFYDTHTDAISAVDDFQDWIQWSDLRD